MQAIKQILSDTGLQTPDDRPLHAYRPAPESILKLEESLQNRLADRRAMEPLAAGFVFWAARHIQLQFPGGQLTWSFVLDALNLPDDQQLGRNLTERGLAWWGREIRLSNSGSHMFLYSLMAEGGIPTALLKEANTYRRVVMGLLSEIEAERMMEFSPWVEQMARRWIPQLPQSFRTDDIAQLLIDLVLSLARLRAALPDDLPEAAAEKWLNRHRPGWISELPLDITPEVAETLILPALRAERGARTVAPRPLCGRALRIDQEGCWHGYLLLHDDSWLPERHFPTAKELRLRLQPAGGSNVQGLVYTALPEDKGWRVGRFGRGGPTAVPFPPCEPFALAAFADGRAKGETIIDPGLPDPADAPSFWRTDEADRSTGAGQLVPLPGAPRTRAPCLWFLAPPDTEPESEGELTLDEIESAPGGFLWRVSGKGTLRFNGKRYRVETGSDEELPEFRLFAFGTVLLGWRLDGNVPVYYGNVDFLGQVGVSMPHPVRETELRRTSGRMLGAEIVEWTQNEDVLARFQFVCLPATTRLQLDEHAPGRITLTAEGLPPGWRIKLSAGDTETLGESAGEPAQLTLETPGNTPDLVRLRFSEPASGREVTLHAAWPSRTGMILDPEGARPTKNIAVSVDALHGWRAIGPQDGRADIQMQLSGAPALALPLSEEASLASLAPLIRAMLAQEGPDAQVNLWLVAGGNQGRRLEIRRYHEKAVIDGSRLRAGLRRDERVEPETVLGAQLSRTRRLTIDAVDTNDPEQAMILDTDSSVDLHEHFPDRGGPWLIRSRIEGRTQRTVWWSRSGQPSTSREYRIRDYAERLQTMLSDPENPEWERLRQLITTLGQSADAGALDQIQALALLPTAAAFLMLRVRSAELANVLDLDATIPIFWPTLPMSVFAEALRVEHMRQITKFSPYLDQTEAETEADSALFSRTGEVGALRPELLGHLLAALAETGLLARIAVSAKHQEILGALLIRNPGHYLADAAQEAARRFDRLPQGVRGLTPNLPPDALPRFSPHLQPVIDAPLVAAEMSAGLRPQPVVADKLKLINLRLVDPVWFDKALPAALNLYLSEHSQ